MCAHVTRLRPYNEQALGFIYARHGAPLPPAVPADASQHRWLFVGQLPRDLCDAELHDMLERLTLVQPIAANKAGRYLWSVLLTIEDAHRLRQLDHRIVCISPHDHAFSRRWSIESAATSRDKIVDSHPPRGGFFKRNGVPPVANAGATVLVISIEERATGFDLQAFGAT